MVASALSEMFPNCFQIKKGPMRIKLMSWSDLSRQVIGKVKLTILSLCVIASTLSDSQVFWFL
jgi:hypothetical protein